MFNFLKDLSKNFFVINDKESSVLEDLIYIKNDFLENNGTISISIEENGFSITES